MDNVEYNNFLITRRQKLRQNVLKMYFLSHRERKIFKYWNQSVSST